MAELGDTTDPRALVPGDPAAVTELAADLNSYGEVLSRAGEGLRRIDTTDGWEGEAAEAFRAAFRGEPRRWWDAGDDFISAARVLDRYAVTLQWAQDRAADAVRLWAAGVEGESMRTDARADLDRARQQLDSAATDAARTVDAACRNAPEGPGFLEQAGAAVARFGADVGNFAASYANAALHNPGTAAAAVGGSLLVAGSVLGEGAGLLLDGTVVLAPAGLGVGALSTAGIATGLGIAGIAGTSLAMDAVGPDRVEVFTAGNDSDGGAVAPEPPFPAPQEITGRTTHGQERIDGSRGDGGVNDAALEDAVQNPTREPEYRPDSQGGVYRYKGKDAVVNLNSNGEVVSAWPKSTSGRRAQ